MREIIFRGKRTDNQEWVYGVPTTDDFDAKYIIQGIFKCDEYRCNGADCYDVDENTISEFTGLTDKNGTKIFEGDIVRATFTYNNASQDTVENRTHIYEIKYHESYCCFYLARKRNNMLFDGNWTYYLKEIEVIGNIHDNPELLGGGEK